MDDWTAIVVSFGTIALTFNVMWMWKTIRLQDRKINDLLKTLTLAAENQMWTVQMVVAIDQHFMTHWPETWVRLKKRNQIHERTQQRH